MDTDQTGQIGRGAVFILGGKIAAFILMAGQAIVIPRVLGPESMGFYFYWLSIFFILGSAFGLGGFSILSRYIPEFWATNQSAIRPLVWRVIGIKFPAVILVLLAGPFLFPETGAHFFIIVLSAIILSISRGMGVIIYAHKEMGKYSLLSFIRLLFRFILILVLFSLLGNKGILLAFLGSSLLVSILFGRATLNSLPKTHGELPRPFKDYLVFGIWLYFGGLLSSLTNWSVVVLSEKQIGDLAIIGYLGVGLQISFFIRYLIFSVGESVFPSLVEFFAQKDQRFRKSIELSWRYTNLILFPIVSGAFILIKPTIVLLIGSEFLPSAKIVNLLMPAVIFFCWSHIHKQILYAHEKKREIFLISFLEFAVFFISGWYLIKVEGILGAPMSLCLGSLVGYIYACRTSLRLEKISGYLPSITKPALASCVMGILLRPIPVTTIFHLLGNLFLGVILYLGIMWMLKGITSQDIERLKAILCRRSL